MASPWMKWAVGEGTTKASAKLVSKMLGLASGSLLGAIIPTLVDGIMQLISGAAFAIVSKHSLRVNKKHLAGCIGFGTVAVMMTTTSVYVFTIPGADVGIMTFVMCLSIIPGALIDRALFSRPLNLRQVFGIVIFIFAGYAILDFPGLSNVLDLPRWLWIGLLLPVLAPVNEAITQAQARNGPLHPMVNNFWIGVTTITECSILLVLLVMVAGTSHFDEWPLRYWLGTVVKGLIVVLAICFKLLSYQDGGSIALKKLIVQGTQLILATGLGVLIFKENFTVGKAIAIPGYFIAFSLTDNGTWQYLKSLVGRRRTTD